MLRCWLQSSVHSTSRERRLIDNDLGSTAATHLSTIFRTIRNVPWGTSRRRSEYHSNWRQFGHTEMLCHRIPTANGHMEEGFTRRKWFCARIIWKSPLISFHFSDQHEPRTLRAHIVGRFANRSSAEDRQWHICVCGRQWHWHCRWTRSQVGHSRWVHIQFNLCGGFLLIFNLGCFIGDVWVCSNYFLILIVESGMWSNFCSI